MKNPSLIIILTILALGLLSSLCEAQKKQYYLITVKFESTDGCSHEQDCWFSATKGNTRNFEAIIGTFQRYVKPYKIITKTFHFTDYRQISYKVFKSLKNADFKPCEKDIGFKFSDYSTSASVTTGLSLTSWNLKPSYFIFMGITNEWMRISAPDSTGTYTVRFSKRVHFINDTTFTFKITK